MISVHIAGVGKTKFGKNPLPLVDIINNVAANEALAHSQIQQIGAVYIAVMNPEEFTADGNFASQVVETLGLTSAPTRREEVARLVDLDQLLKSAYRERNLDGYFEANRILHRFIAQMARHERLYRLIAEMRQEIRKSRLLLLQLPQRLDYSMREYDQILDAFLKRNAYLAEGTVLKHLSGQMTAIKRLLQSSEDETHAQL